MYEKTTTVKQDNFQLHWICWGQQN